ncbi:MAG: hypothetical protein JWP08_198 [Bryobacterales bacterium]|nr:hypothetical protein [Bryobacterales bacterium]
MTLTGGRKCGLLLGLCALSGASGPLLGPVHIVVYDDAALGPELLTTAEKVTGKILLSSGTEATWNAGVLAERSRLTRDASPLIEGHCASPLLPDIVRVQVLAHAPAGRSRQTLGFSLPCSRTGIQITIYADRVEEVSQRMLPGFSRVLGYAMAHELGHVLLRSGGHEDSGLMKGVWSKVDWQRAAFSIIPFTPAQARQMAEQGRNRRVSNWLSYRPARSVDHLAELAGFSPAAQ